MSKGDKRRPAEVDEDAFDKRWRKTFRERRRREGETRWRYGGEDEWNYIEPERESDSC